MAAANINIAAPSLAVPNIAQLKYFTDVAVKVVAALFKARNKQFLMVYWSRDPDGSQHAQQDSPNAITPGINGPTSAAAVKNADDNLKALLDALNDSLDLPETTDVVVAADHGFSTISKQSNTSASTQGAYSGVPPGFLPPGYVPIDLAKSLACRCLAPMRPTHRWPSNTVPEAAWQQPDRQRPCSSRLGRGG